jgi:hypothetical protein
MRAGAWIIPALCLVSTGAWAQQHDAKERTRLAKALKSVQTTLANGLLASEREGKPISARFDVDRGALELVVYTAKGDGFSQIHVDPKTGKIAKVEEIDGGAELAEARAQSEAMTSAKLALHQATERIVKMHPGSRAVSVTPRVQAGHPVADVVLLKGSRFSAVTSRLD